MFRTDIKRMIIFFLHRHKYLCKRMIGKFDVSISIPPFEHSIVKRLIFLDEIILEIERFALRFYDQKIKMICYFEHFLFSKGSWSKILRNSFFQIFCFPNVKYRIFFIFEKIDSWLFRKFIEMIGDEHEERSEVKYFYYRKFRGSFKLVLAEFFLMKGYWESKNLMIPLEIDIKIW